MKKLLAALIFAGFGIVIAQDAPQAPADKPAPPKNEQGGRPGRPGGPGQFNPERFQAQMLKRMETQMAELLKEYDKNQDGALDAAEKEAMEKDLDEALKKARLANSYQRIKVIDADGDLKLSNEEKEKAPQRLREDMQNRGPRGGGFGGGFGPGGGNGFGPRDGQGPRGGGMGPRGGNGPRGPRGGNGPRGNNPPPEPPPAE